MHYQFSEFILDTENQSLSHRGQALDLNHQNHRVLQYFVENAGQLVKKDDLIDGVWDGRHVTENSIDQAISKIRKTLNSAAPGEYIRTVYKKGHMFVAQVHALQDKPATQIAPVARSKRPVIFAGGIAALMLLSVLWLVPFGSETGAVSAVRTQAPVMFIEGAKDPTNWADLSALVLLREISALGGGVNVVEQIEAGDDPTAALNNYWRIQPDLKVVRSQILRRANDWELQLRILDRSGETLQSFHDAELSRVIQGAGQWLAGQVDSPGWSEELPLLPEVTPHAMEMYLRGLSEYTQESFETARNYFQLSVDENPNFHLAHLRLARVQRDLGQTQEALVTLQTLLQMQISQPVYLTAMTALADLVDLQGDYDRAIDIFQRLIDEYQGDHPLLLKEVHFLLSYALASVQQYSEALDELAWLEDHLRTHPDPLLHADVLHKRGSIQLQTGETAAAREAAEKSLRIYQDLGEMLGASKAHSLLARVANYEADYPRSVSHLMQSLAITESRGYLLGEGAALNELIYALTQNGQLKEALMRLQRMREIAIEIDYFAMLMAAKQAEFEIARFRQQWTLAEQLLDDYLRSSRDNGFARGLFKHRLMRLDLLLDQDRTDGVEALLDAVQDEINASGETRFQGPLNRQRARWLFLQGNESAAMELITASRPMLEQLGDAETLVQINNLVARRHLQAGRLQAALDALDGNRSLPASAYPQSLIRARIYASMGRDVDALRAATAAQLQANEFWTREDEVFLQSLQERTPD